MNTALHAARAAMPAPLVAVLAGIALLTVMPATRALLTVLPVAAALFTALPALAATPAWPDAAASDPVKMGWMQGSPPPPDKVIRHADLSLYQFPQTRWSFANFRQLVPTTNVWRGGGPVAELPRALRDDIDAVTFKPLGSDTSMTWEQSLAANYTDAILVLHRGRIVYERYFGVMTPHTQHMAMSVTKSFFGTLAAMLVAEGKLDPEALVPTYIPELKDSAFGDATVRQVLDMTTGLAYSEDYTNPQAEIWSHLRAGSVFPRPPGYDGPKSFYEFLATVRKQGEHGERFAYKTVNSDVVGWLIRRVTGQSVGEVLATRIWHKVGVEEDGYILVDTVGNEFAGGGLNVTLRDLARFGEMMRLDGRYNGQQIVPKAVVDDIRHGANREDFAKAGYATLPGWSYRNQWWVSHDAHGAYMARGVHGQAIYVDPKAEMVIARFASHPQASNVHLDAKSLPAYRAVAELLLR
jgi:CubicO group peptidase (beta-lactamase class C family)